MFKSKSFRLNHELEAKVRKREILYAPKRICLIKCITILLLIGFALLLILSNVDFTCEPSELSTTLQSINENVISAITNETMNDAVQYTNAASVRTSVLASFTCKDNRSCKTVICTGGPINTLSYEMENEILASCANNLFDVIIENCTFYGKTIGAYTMSGLYKLNSLTIRNCTLETIIDNAFSHSTVQNLINLTFEGVQLQSLNAKSFKGLETVKHFKLFNVQQTASTPLKAQNFIQPLATNLSSLAIQQSQEASSNTLTIYDPTDWLGSSEAFVNLLFVDLNGSNFNNTLNRNSFVNLLAVQQLSLANCRLQTIGEGTFESISKTLKFLDLRDNQLQMLVGDFIAIAPTTGISINLARNQWSCECNNAAIIEYVKQTNGSYTTEEPECATPTEYKAVQLRYVELGCDDTSTSVTTRTILSTLSFDTTEMAPLTTTLTTVVISEKTDKIDGTEISKGKDTTWKSTPTQSEIIITQPSTTNSIATETQPWTSNGTLQQTLQTTSAPTTTAPTTTAPTTTAATTTQVWTSSTINYSECYSDPALKLLSCEKKLAVTNSLLTIPVPICNYDAIFSVYAISSTSVQLLIGQSATGLQVAYFQDMTCKANYTETISTYSSLDINELKSNESYTFCIIPVGGSATSPFNCRSTYLPLETETPWLINGDRVSFYAITISVTIFCGIIGMALIIWLMRWRPTLIWGNKRIRRIASTSYEVLLLPKLNRSSLDSKQFALTELRSSMNDTLTVDNSKSTDYMQYIKGLELNKQPQVTHICDNRPPLNEAPTLPSEADDKLYDYVRHSHSIYSDSIYSVENISKANIRARIRQQCPTVDETENEYESFEFYQELH